MESWASREVRAEFVEYDNTTSNTCVLELLNHSESLEVDSSRLAKPDNEIWIRKGGHLETFYFLQIPKSANVARKYDCSAEFGTEALEQNACVPILCDVAAL